jgi:hypothetical protein
VLRLDQLKIAQEVITLVVFVPFAVLYMKQPLRLSFLWAGCWLLAGGRGVLHDPVVAGESRIPTPEV